MTRRAPRQRGFTLIEAMIALVIIAFGLLALAGMQIMLSRNADVAKQRTEAMRLAQERMEVMRAYVSIAPVPAVPPAPPPLAWETLATAMSDPLNPLTSTFSNTIFSRSWFVGGTAADAMRPVSVTVDWTDRAGEPQSVTLTSVIANTDPTRVGALGLALPTTVKFKYPQNRNINIPAAALELDEGKKSVYQFKPDLAVVFNNTTGLVVERCNTIVSDSTYTSGTAGCIPFKAAIVSGFVTGAVLPAGVPAAGATPVLPTGVNTSALTGWNMSEAISCVYAIAKDQNSAANLANAHYYLCVIPLMTSGGWSGTVRLGGIDITQSYKVCRVQFDLATGLNPDQRNVQPYTNVQISLDNQNYFIDNSLGPACTPPTPPFTGATLVLHQDCRSSAPPTAVNCPATADNTPL